MHGTIVCHPCEANEMGGESRVFMKFRIFVIRFLNFNYLIQQLPYTTVLWFMFQYNDIVFIQVVPRHDNNIF